MKEQISRARWIGTIVITAIALYLCWVMLRPFIDVLGWAAVLVIVFYPLHKRLAAKIQRRGLSALASCLIVLIVFVGPLTLVVLALTKELTGVARSFPEHTAALSQSYVWLTQKVSAWLDDRLLFDSTQPQAFIAEQLTNAGTALLQQSMGLIGNLIGGIFKGFFVLFTTYYLFRDGDRFVRELPSVLPFERAQSESLINRVKEVVGAGVYGIVSIAMIQGLLSGFAFWILGIPSPVLWAVLTAFICLIPIAGSFMVWLPASAYLFVTGQWGKGIGLVLWGALVVSTIDNFLRPKLIKNQTKLHEVFIFFSVLGGIKAFGLVGIVLGPVIFAITLALLETLSRGSGVIDAHSQIPNYGYERAMDPGRSPTISGLSLEVRQ
jgi:predicted PurR-regulated permease PerM